MDDRGSSQRHPRSTAFLLAQVGARAAALFAERLQALDLAPAHAGALRAIARNAGVSQQALASQLGMVPSRLVALLDDLQERGLVERRDHADDRRVHALHLTEKGSRTMADLGRVARAHDDAVCAALTDKERQLLASLLARIADDQGLTPGVHPGFANVGAEQRGEGAGAKKTRPERAKPAEKGRRPSRG